MCIHCLSRKQKCRLKSTTTNGWRHFGQSEQRKSSALFPIQSEKSPDSGIFTCDPTKKCIMPSSCERHKGIIGRGHDLRLSPSRLTRDKETKRSAKTKLFAGDCRENLPKVFKFLSSIRLVRTLHRSFDVNMIQTTKCSQEDKVWLIVIVF